MNLLRDNVGEPIGFAVGETLRSWASDVLADKGAVETLPHINAWYASRDAENSRTAEEWKVVLEKMRLVSESPTRLDALKAGLESGDLAGPNSIQWWAIEELAKMNTAESREVLLDYLRRAQRQCFEDWDNRPGQAESRVGLTEDDDIKCRHLWDVYNTIIHYLLLISVGEPALNQAGVFPRKYFIVL